MTQNNKQFSIWEDNGEQWDANELPESDGVVWAQDHVHAAEKYADEECGLAEYEIVLIVRDDETLKFESISLTKQWALEACAPTTLEKLCAP